MQRYYLLFIMGCLGSKPQSNNEIVSDKKEVAPLKSEPEVKHEEEKAKADQSDIKVLH
jgi:hypothetical protein